MKTILLFSAIFFHSFFFSLVVVCSVVSMFAMCCEERYRARIMARRPL